MGQSETVYYLNGGQISLQTLSDKVFGTSRVVRQFHKHNGTNWDCLVPQWLSDHKHDGTKWHCLVPQGWSDIITNTIGQSETAWYLKGCQTTSQTRWDKVRLFTTSRVVRQLHRHNGTMWVCLVHQGCSDNSTNSMGKVRLVSTSIVVRHLLKHDVTKWDSVLLQWLSQNFTNTMGQCETVLYLKGCQTTSQTRRHKFRLFSSKSRDVWQLHKHDGKSETV